MPDDGLLEGALRGEEAAFVTLVHRYHRTLVGIAGAYVNSHATAEDVAQETWIAVLRGLEAFEGRASFKTWLFRICANRARTVAAREHRQVTSGLPQDVGGPDPNRFNHLGMWTIPPEPFTEDVERRLEQAQEMELLEHVVRDLPEPAHSVVTLRDREGLSNMEVAQILGLSHANVRVILHRARASIRQELERRASGARR